MSFVDILSSLFIYDDGEKKEELQHELNMNKEMENEKEKKNEKESENEKEKKNEKESEKEKDDYKEISKKSKYTKKFIIDDHIDSKIIFLYDNLEDDNIKIILEFLRKVDKNIYCNELVFIFDNKEMLTEYKRIILEDNYFRNMTILRNKNDISRLDNRKKYIIISDILLSTDNLLFFITDILDLSLVFKSQFNLLIKKYIKTEKDLLYKSLKKFNEKLASKYLNITNTKIGINYMFIKKKKIMYSN